jgi:predicted nucleic acid-binding protein
MTISNYALLDSNVIVYAADKASPYHKVSKSLRDKGVKGEVFLCVCPQVLIEFFAIVTDPKRVKKPISSSQAIKEVEKYFIAPNILKIFPNALSFKKLIELAKKYKVKKQEIFDLKLVATMLSNGINKIYTFNFQDFSKFREIQTLIPE